MRGEEVAEVEALVARFAARMRDHLTGEVPFDAESELVVVVASLAELAGDDGAARFEETARKALVWLARADRVETEGYGDRRIRRNQAENHEGAIVAAADWALTALDEDVARASAEVASAARELDDVRGRAAAAQADLEAAVEALDGAAIERLRPEVMLSLPGQVADAQRRLLDARIAEAEARRSGPHARHERAAADAEKAAAVVADAQRQLDDAVNAHAAAARTVANAAASVDAARSTASTLRAERDAFVEDATRAQRERAVRLAGLSVEEPVG